MTLLGLAGLRLAAGALDRSSSRPVRPPHAFTRRRRGMATPAGRRASSGYASPRLVLCEGRAPQGIRGHMGADGDARVGS